MANINLVPVMTWYDAPSGLVSASSEYGQPSQKNLMAWKAFDGIIDDDQHRWVSAITGANQWLQYQFSKIKSVYAYSLASVGCLPNNWTFKGSNNGINWDILDNQAGQSNNLTTPYNTLKTYNLASVANYQYFRLNITSAIGEGNNYVCITEMKIMGSDAPVVTPRVVSWWGV